MTDDGHNTMAKRIADVQQFQKAEAELLNGCTIGELAAVLECSKEQGRRIVRALKALGCDIVDDFVPGTRSPVTYTMTAKSRLFTRHD